MSSLSINSVSIISGKQGEGKTILLQKIIKELSSLGLQPGGIISQGIWRNNLRDEIKARNLHTNEEILFCQRNPTKSWISSGNFWINPDSIPFSLAAIREKNCDYIVLDEIGKFELDGKGWFEAIRFLLKNNNKPLILVVRNTLIEDVLLKFSIHPEIIISVNQDKNKPVLEILPKSILKLIYQ